MDRKYLAAIHGTMALLPTELILGERGLALLLALILGEILLVPVHQALLVPISGVQLRTKILDQDNLDLILGNQHLQHLEHQELGDPILTLGPAVPDQLGAWGPNPNVRRGSPGPVPSPWGPNPNFRPGVSNIRPGTPVTSSGVNFDDFMMRLSGSGLNCPGVRVSVRRGFGRQEYKYEGPIQLSCVVGSRTVQQGTCYNYRECSQLICRFTSCKSKGGNVRKRRL